MPDANGHLSPVEIRAVLQWLTEKHGGVPYPCPVSGHTEIWIVNEYVIQGIVFPVQAGNVVSPMAWPVVQVACAACGYTLYLNAALIGLYPKPPQPANEG